MALEWQPRFPDQVDRLRRRKQEVGAPEQDIQAAYPIPIPAPPVPLIWLAKFPDTAKKTRLDPALISRAVAPLPVLPLLSPLSWKPTFPDSAKSRKLGARHPSLSPFQSSSQAGIARLGWHPSFPDSAKLTRRVAAGPYTGWLVAGETILGAAHCVLWNDLSFSQAALTPEAFSQADLLTEALSQADLTGVDFCGTDSTLGIGASDPAPAVYAAVYTSDGSPVVTSDGSPLVTPV